MEGLILIIIIGIITSIFNKIGDKEPKPMPPFGGEKPMKPIKTVKSNQQRKEIIAPKKQTLDDFSKYIFHQVDETKLNDSQIEENKDETNSRNYTVSKPTLHRTSDESSRNEQKKQTDFPNVVPTSKEALIQAMISSEILGPPLSKRR